MKRGYWIKERCLEEALKYKSRKDFQDNNRGAYESSRKNGWLDEVCEHIKKEKIKSKGYWTKERCLEEALKYKSRKDFRLNSRKSYSISVKEGWLDEVCNHIPGWKPKGYWTKERCLEESLKYNKKIDFLKKSSSSYQISYNNGWLDEVCEHMEINGNRFKRCIYAVEFPDNHVYIGLTYNFNERKYKHTNDYPTNPSTVLKYIKSSGLTPEFKKITEYLEVSKASKLEGEILEKYIDEGWEDLNIRKCGVTGGNILKWTKEKCLKESKKYKTVTEFKINASGACESSRKNGWLNEFFPK